MEDTIDLLKIKIEKAKDSLSPETRAAIDSVSWRQVIYDMRNRRKFNISQLEDIELETELVLSGLTNPEQYPSELQARLKISKNEIDSLVQEMNELVFKPIRSELIKRIHRSDILSKKITPNKIGTEDLKQIDEPAPANNLEAKKEDSILIRTILSQKLSNTHSSPHTKTEYTVANISKKEESGQVNKWQDPYRVNPKD